MVLRLFFHLILLSLFFGCSAIGYVRYEKGREATKPPEVSKSEEYHLAPEEWWFDYPFWRWSFGFYLWEPYWWYPYYYTRCPGCYIYDPYVFKEHRRFERKNINPERSPEAEPESEVDEPSRVGEGETDGGRRFER